MKKILTVISLAAVVCGGQAYARSVRSINDGWTFAKPGEQPAAVHIPHSWNSDAYSTRDYYRGPGLYTRRIAQGEFDASRRTFLKLDGAATNSIVKIDDKEIGRHVGGYSAHVLDISPYLRDNAEHTLTVEVDNSSKDVPPYSADFTFMGGLYRDAWLVDMAPVHLNVSEGPACGFKVTPSFNADGSGNILVSGILDNDSDAKASASLTVRIFAPDGALVAEKTSRISVKPGDSRKFSVDFSNLKGVSLWSPEKPELYRIVTEVRTAGDTDLSETYTAFRTFGFDKEGRFLLNGKPYKLRGMCRHQDQAPMGIALTDEQHRRDMKMMKDMGTNFIRISHYPQDDAILEMCDRMGMIAWEEIPVIDFVPINDTFADNAETMTRQMIRQHYNHPSIAMWGYMNEILLRVPQEGRKETYKRTVDLANRLEKVVREEDPSRLSTMAFHGSDVYHDAGLGEITDVKGWNLYSGWYGGKFADFEATLSRQHREHPDHKLIVSEYGAGSDRRIHSLKPRAFDFSMEYQQDYLEHYLPVLEDSAFVAGGSHWNFIDFSSANRAESMPHINNKGLVTNNRIPKDVYYYYQATWTDPTDREVAHIATRDWSDRTEVFDTDSKTISRPVKVYTNRPDVVLTSDNGSFASSGIQNNTVVFDVPLHAGDNVLRLASASDPGKVLDVATIHVNPIWMKDGQFDLGTEEMAINVGSDCYFRSDDSGLTWLPDLEYGADNGYGHIGGKPAVSQDLIALTADEPLLQRALTGLEEYRVNLLPGNYEVELSFADLSAPSKLSAYMLGANAGSGDSGVIRQDISINGNPVETAFAPGAMAGAKSMVKRRYSANVGPDGILSIKFTPAEGAVSSLSALKIRRL